VLKNNKLNLLISIVCAIVLWAYITTVINPETERTIANIPVELINIEALNDRGFTDSDVTPPQIEIVVAGARSEVARLTWTDFRATADVAGYSKGTATVPVTVYTPNNIELVEIRPEAVQVEVVDLITVFKPVHLEFEESFSFGTEPGFIEVTPVEMAVVGVAEAVDTVDYIRALVPEGALTEELSTFRVEVVAIDREGQPVYNVSLSQRLIEVTGALCTTKRVPLHIETIGEPHESVEVTYMFIPNFITIRGAAADIEGIEEVTGRPVDLSSITSTVELSIDDLYLDLPEGIEVANASANLSVRIEVQGIARKEFRYTADMIEIRNLAPSLSGHVNTGSVVVTVLAPRDIIDDIMQDDIRLYVDAEETIRPGSAIEMEVLAEYDIEIKEISIEPIMVRVTIIRE